MSRNHPVLLSVRSTAFAALAAGLAVGAATEVEAADLLIEIAGVHSEQGALFAAIHGPESAATFPDDAGAVYRVQLPAVGGMARFTIHDVPLGQYAVAVFHDENGNGDLDANMLGVPTEGYGFSRDAASTFGPPEFGAAAFDLDSEPETVRVTLAY